MKPYRSIKCHLVLCCVGLAGLLGVAPDLSGAPPKAAVTTAKTNAAPHEEEGFPKSEFDERGGKDPFFPLRTLARGDLKPDPNKDVCHLLVLKGISGPPNRRLAIINNQTLEAGEKREVTTTAGKVEIRCLEIREDSVVIECPNQGGRKELKLRDGVN